jgi:hypothetical protein
MSWFPPRFESYTTHCPSALTPKLSIYWLPLVT